MQKRMIALLALGAGSLPALAQTSGGVTLYGLLDTTIRYSTHEDAAGHGRTQMTDGVLTGSRWGLRGTEDIGGGNKAWFILESGFAPDTGTSQQGGRLFGRTAVIGLDGGYGKLAIGRQYTLAHEVLSSYEAMAFANNSIVGYQGGNYTGLRYDNTVKYIKSFNGLQVAAAYTFGEVPGSIKSGSAAAGSLVYSSGPLEIGTVYQQTQNVTSAFFGAVPAALASKQTVWGLGGTWKAARAQYYLGYTNNRLDVADYRNNVGYVGTRFNITDALAFIGTLQYDWLRHAGQGGKRLTTAGMLDYNFSKRTDVYVEVDYTHLQGQWIALNSSPTFANSGNTYGNSSRIGVMAGVRHKF
ncbi:porin gram-negative type [Cupriavidus necator N-1]|uniref:Porin gram-negative type n=1 Tax=Cupriavidus necator (strain ATCC 43291 / DSM 13513 / CCUG 52238 / LMG 8453 / N-1) TaxID=1042878 RepID=F8GR33_CUPNN|nr:porin [Cupriavidus necator]AEI80778.1 porin gram-negative type [Cupriavidus necator N-1]MDX6009595.1 porin [Cupriavidus necator]